MAFEGSFDDPKFKGWRKYLNSHTIRGRSNWAKLWLSIYAVSFIAFKISKRAKKPPEENVKQLSTEPAYAPISDPSVTTNPQPWNLPITEHSFSCQPSGATPVVPDQPIGGKPNLSSLPPQQPFYPCYPPPAYYPYYPPLPPHLPTQSEGSNLPKNEKTQLPGTSYPPPPYPYYPPTHYYSPALYPYATPPIYSQQGPQISSVPPLQVPTVTQQQVSPDCEAPQITSVPPPQIPMVNQQQASPDCPEQSTTKTGYASSQDKLVDKGSDAECTCGETN